MGLRLHSVVRPVYLSPILLLQELPFDPTVPSPFLDLLDLILNVMMALAIRGYLIFVLVGFMVYVTGLSDALGKILVGAGVVIYIAGPLLLNFFAGVVGVETVTLAGATAAWLSLIGMTDAEIVSILVLLGDMVAATCLLVGAILYFTPSANDLKSRGQSLIVRAIMFAPILAFFHIAPWI